VGDSDNIYVAGSSDDTWGSPLNNHSGGSSLDAFIVKLNANGALQWNTFLGTSSHDTGIDIAHDGSGDVYVSGASAVTWGTPVNAHSGYIDAYIAKLDANGVLQWNTFLGSSSGVDEAYGITLDSSRYIYVTGRSDNPWGSPVNRHAGGYNGDAFVAKLNASGVLQWNTFLGSSEHDKAHDIAVDGTGNVYLTGTSYATWGLPLNSHTGGYDPYVAKLNTSGVLQWNTFLGSSDYDEGYGITLDGGDNVYVAGRSGATWGSPVNDFEGEPDAFIAKLSSDSATGAMYYGLKALGDINGKSGQDSAVVEDTAVTIKQLNTAILNQFQFADGQIPVEVEVMEDINNNGAPELVMLGTGSTKGEVRDSLTGQHLGMATFSANFTPIDLEIVPDQNGNQIPELAVLQKKPGATRVEIRDPLNGNLIKTVYFNPNFVPKDLVVLPNVGGTAAPDLAVLQDATDPEAYDRVEIRDMASRQRLRYVWFGKGYEVKQLEMVEDVNNNGKPELAVLRAGSVKVLVKDAGTGKYIRNIGFHPEYTPQKLLVVPDTNKNGKQELGLLARHPDTGVVKVELRDVKTGKRLVHIWYGKREEPLDAAVYPDINGNGSPEIGVLGHKIDNPDQLLVRIKDARTGAHIQAIPY
jgi:hypothetical protein